jgi:hypothetical protein
MKVADTVRNKIEKFPEGYVFGYDNFQVKPEKESALKITLFRLTKAGMIERLSKGRFYKPKQGIIKNLRPNEYEVVKDLLFENRKPVGYITGLGIFNKLGLTTQLSNIIQIGSNFDKKQIQRGKYKIKFIRQWNPITRNNIYLLQFLDSIRFIKNIPDTTVDQSIKRLSYLVSELKEDKIKSLTNLALNYPASTRALTGAMLEKIGYPSMANRLLKSLKPTTWYDIDISEKIIPDKQKWKIK